MTTRMRIDEAAAWFAAQDRPDFDWDGFTNWLEVDPVNRVSFDEMLLLDCALDDRSGLVWAGRRRALTGTVTLSATRF